jgi:peptidoglycan/LPS O-acetylase OafA/YrhL
MQPACRCAAGTVAATLEAVTDTACASIPATTTTTAAPARTRLDWVDRLRVWLTILVIAHHCAATYASIPAWYVALGGRDASAGALTAFMVLNQLYFMGGFFLLSGLFTTGSVDRKGPARFVRDRLVRLGIPFLAYLVVVRPLAMLPGGIATARADAAAHRPFSLLGYVAFGGDPGVTWFLEVLIVFSLGYALVRAARPRAAAPAPAAPAAPPWWGPVLLVAVLAVANFWWLWLVPLGTYWPVVGLPSPTFLPQYLLLFAVGVLAARRGWLTGLSGRWAVPAVAALLVGTVATAATLRAGNGPAHPLTGAVQALGTALFAVAAVTLLVLVFRRWFARPAGRLTRLLSDQAFVVYLTHPVVLVWVAVALMAVPGPSALRAALLFAVAAPLCWLLAWTLRRIPAVRWIV